MRYTYARRVRRSSIALMSAALGVVLALGVIAASAFPSGSQAAPGLSHRSVCSRSSRTDAAYCHAHILTHAGSGKTFATTSYSSGLSPQRLWDAYKLPGAANNTFVWNNQTIAIVDAYDNPNAASDLLAYRQQFGLPLCSNGGVDCLFSKVNQSGASSPLPVADMGWGQEIDLDIEMASATCPNCKVLLVEAASNYFSDLGAAEDRAAVLGANAISNSYGGGEFSSETSSAYDGHFTHPGIAITVSTGDSGYGTEFPATSAHVTAVGGTSLQSSSNARGWTETAWSGTGSGCSYYVPHPSWQPLIGTCTHRVVADVSAVADPYTGVAVYDSYGSSGGANWYVFGGTSVSSPIIAGVYALAGNAGGLTPGITYGEYPYAHRSGLFDVVSGSNGRCTSWRNRTNLALCTAVTGYDGPTGLGTPDGINAF